MFSNSIATVEMPTEYLSHFNWNLSRKKSENTSAEPRTPFTRKWKKWIPGGNSAAVTARDHAACFGIFLTGFENMEQNWSSMLTSV